MTDARRNIALSVVIPVYGSAAILPELVKQLAAMQTATPALNGEMEAILVCDASPDDSWRIMTRLAAEYAFLTCIRLRRNVGQHNTIMAGLRRAGGRVIVTMDDDLQHAPRDIPTLYAQIVNGADVCYVRFEKQHHAVWKRCGSRLNDIVAEFLLNKPKNLYLSSFKAFSREISDEVIKYPGPFVYIDGLILASTSDIRTVELEHHPRLNGKSGYSLKKSILLWTEMATGFSVTPLRLASTVGILTSSLGFLLAILFIIQKFTLDRMPDGWSSLIVTVLIMGGVQLLALGAVGEYLGRVLLTANRKPQYTVGEVVGDSAGSPRRTGAKDPS